MADMEKETLRTQIRTLRNAIRTLADEVEYHATRVPGLLLETSRAMMMIADVVTEFDERRVAELRRLLAEIPPRTVPTGTGNALLHSRSSFAPRSEPDLRSQVLPTSV